MKKLSVVLAAAAVLALVSTAFAYGRPYFWGTGRGAGYRSFGEAQYAGRGYAGRCPRTSQDAGSSTQRQGAWAPGQGRLGTNCPYL